MITALVVLILFFAQEWLLIIAGLSLVFLYYVLTTVAPAKVTYKFTTKGVQVPDREQVIAWEWLGHYWIEKRWGHTLAVILPKTADLPALQLIIDPQEKEIEKILAARLVKIDPPKNALDKISAWLYRHLPLEK